MKAHSHATGSALHLRGGRVIDPANDRDGVGDVYLLSGKVVDANTLPAGTSWTVIDVADKIVTPGLIDVHVHLREPGGAHKETIATGTQAAAQGGFTTIVAMPNTRPPLDSPETLGWLAQQIRDHAVVNVFVTGCLSQNLEGKILAPLKALAQAGAAAFTDDGACIQDEALMKAALQEAKALNLPVMDHCQDYALVKDGVMHEGKWSAILGLAGWPSEGESRIVARNARLAEATGAHLHCQHLSAAASVQIVREARARGVPISGEVMPHHLALTDEALQGFDTNFKMNPPLRTQEDIDALREGLADGTLEILSTDHAPHTVDEKSVEFDRAPFGVVGLETALGIWIKTLIDSKTLNWLQLIAKLTCNPAKLMSWKNKGHLAVGADADITVIDPAAPWTVDAKSFASKSRNTPFDSWKLRGRAVMTIVGGKTVWSHEGLPRHLKTS